MTYLERLHEGQKAHQAIIDREARRNLLRVADAMVENAKAQAQSLNELRQQLTQYEAQCVELIIRLRERFGDDVIEENL